MQFNESTELNCCALKLNIYFLNFSEVNCIEVQCKKDKNVDQGSALECRAAHPRLEKSLTKKKNPCMFFFCIGAFISIGREIRCLLYAGFFIIDDI